MTRKLHFCWLGSRIPNSVLTRLSEWKKMCPDLDICGWTDDNISPDEYKDFSFWKRAYKEKRWGFASDIVRFSKIYEEGGFYLDCDVAILKPLSNIPAPKDHLIMGYMYDGVISGGFFYAPPKHPIIKKILEYYKDVNDGFYVLSNTIITHCINNNVPDILMNGSYYTSNKHKLTIFPKEYFCQPSFFQNKPFVLDLFAGSWREGASELFAGNKTYMSLYKTFRRKVSCFLSIMKNEFRNMYLMALIGRKIQCKEYWRTCYGKKGGAVLSRDNL